MGDLSSVTDLLLQLEDKSGNTVSPSATLRSQACGWVLLYARSFSLPPSNYGLLVLLETDDKERTVVSSDGTSVLNAGLTSVVSNLKW